MRAWLKALEDKDFPELEFSASEGEVVADVKGILKSLSRNMHAEERKQANLALPKYLSVRDEYCVWHGFGRPRNCAFSSMRAPPELQARRAF
jgi:hypothetical protein